MCLYANISMQEKERVTEVPKGNDENHERILVFLSGIQ